MGISMKIPCCKHSRRLPYCNPQQCAQTRGTCNTCEHLHSTPTCSYNVFQALLSNADQYVSVVFGDSQHTRSHRCAASSTATSRVDPNSDHCLVSPVILCYAFAIHTTTLTLVSLVVQCGGSFGLFLASEEKIFINQQVGALVSLQVKVFGQWPQLSTF